MSALGTLGMSNNESQNGQSASLSVFGEGRREVLTNILDRGMRGDTVAKGATRAVQRKMQFMDRERAAKLIMKAGKSTVNGLSNFISGKIESNKDLKSISGSSHGDEITTPTEDDEAVEALRILLIQNRVAQQNLNAENTRDALGNANEDLGPGVEDAGEVDSRLSGCGPISAAIVNAIKMWQEDVVTNAEVLDLVKKRLTISTSCCIFRCGNGNKIS